MKNRTKYRAITGKQLKEALSYIPFNHRKLVEGKFQLLAHQMADGQGRAIDAHYDEASDTILIYAFTESEIRHGVHLETIWHEVGHVVFIKTLKRKTRLQWEQVRNNDAPFPIILSDIYSRKMIWEEEFCFTYALLIRERFYERNGMKSKLKKTKQSANEIPQRSDFTRKIIQMADKKNDKPVCYREAMRRFDVWAGKLK
ncbi:MAG: hypothetical protein ABH871_09180 [Pseudomonadota bacterium]